MTDERAARFVPLTRVGDVGRARVLAALLQAEGIEVRLHSEAFGPYPVTVGELAQTELWVPDDRIGEASAVLLDADVNDAIGAVDSERGLPIVELRIVAGVLIALIALAVVLRLMRVF
jgi:Putative prokaryotic signal transducing protein